MSGMMLMPIYAVGITPDEIQPTQTEGTTTLTNLGGKIYGAIFTAGIVLSVIVMAVLGIKYMMGSTEEKSEYKKSMVPYVIGALCIFGASTIASIVYNLTNQVSAGA